MFLGGGDGVLYFGVLTPLRWMAIREGESNASKPCLDCLAFRSQPLEYLPAVDPWILSLARSEICSNWNTFENGVKTRVLLFPTSGGRRDRDLSLDIDWRQIAYHLRPPDQICWQRT